MSPLLLGRTSAREPEPVTPVPRAHLEAVLPHLNRHVRAMVEVQTLTGMRPREVVQMRGCDIDFTNDIWIYRPRRHKTEHHGRIRAIPLGPRAQAILQPFLTQAPNSPLFSPRAMFEERCQARRAARKAPMTPSQHRRPLKARPKRRPAETYSTNSYAQAIVAGCKAARVPSWSPNRLRHLAATEIRKRYHLETARVLLGHSSAAVTEVDAEMDRERGIEAMRQAG